MNLFDKLFKNVAFKSLNQLAAISCPGHPRVGSVVWVTIAMATGLALAPPVAAATKPLLSPQEISILLDNLESKEWNRPKLLEIFKNPKIRKLNDMISINVTKPVVLKTTSYAHFAEEPALNRAQTFGEKWQKYLDHAETVTGVEKEIILAILLVETNLGTYTGSHDLMSIYPSIFVDATQLLEQKWVLEDDKMRNRVKKKRAWALEQIQALLQMHRQHRVDIFDLKGSYAGAMGACQFLPTSYLSYAKSFSGGLANLFKIPDAILSVGNYLSKHGYQRGSNPHKNKKAIYAYNHSDVYTNIVMKVAQRLQQRGLPRASH